MISLCFLEIMLVQHYDRSEQDRNTPRGDMRSISEV